MGSGGEGREREDPKLLLNQGPSEPCYATVNLTLCHEIFPPMRLLLSSALVSL